MASAIAPEPVNPVVVIAMLPVVALLVLKLLLSVTAPPKIEIGPAKVVALASVMVAVLVDLPMIKLDKVLPKFQPDVLNALVKLSPAD